MVVTLWAFGAVRGSAAPPAAEPVAKAMEVKAETACDSASESSLEAVASTAAKTCEDYGFFEDRKKCEASCKRGEKCQKKQMCGGQQCPPPGYCWKCG
jgi:hypothetical protein